MTTKTIELIVNSRELTMISNMSKETGLGFTVSNWDWDALLFLVNVPANLYLKLLCVNGSFFQERCIFDVIERKQ